MRGAGNDAPLHAQIGCGLADSQRRLENGNPRLGKRTQPSNHFTQFELDLYQRSENWLFENLNRATLNLCGLQHIL